VRVPIARPRSRETIIEHPHYYKIRNHIIHFLVRHAKHESADGAVSGKRGDGAPVMVDFEEDSLTTH
jgi:nitrate/nitrite transport system ATP-binding protein